MLLLLKLTADNLHSALLNNNYEIYNIHISSPENVYRNKTGNFFSVREVLNYKTRIKVACWKSSNIAIAKLDFSLLLPL